MPISILHTYLAELRETAAGPSGATEHSYRPALKRMIAALADHLDRPLAYLTLEPGHVAAAGAPDAVLYGPTRQDLYGILNAPGYQEGFEAVLRIDFPHIPFTAAYGIGSAWSESGVTWNTRPSYTEAYGSASVTHGAWGWYSFDVTSLVRGWVNGCLPNYGAMLRGPEWSGSDLSWKGFSTREEAYTPQLVITYGGYTTSTDARPVDESLSGEEPVHVIIEALADGPNADSPSLSLCQQYSSAGEKCLALR